MQSGKKDSPILVIGFGSIGRRHYRNLVSLGYTNVSVYDVDQEKLKEENIQGVPILTDRIFKEFPIVFICNPSHLHIATALRAAEAGCHMFIEKPLALSTLHIKKLDTVVRQKHLTVMVACNYRFNLAFDFLKNILQSGELGKPLTANVAMGYDLRTARPWIDYKKTYAVSQHSGGGVLFDSGSHVVDYLITLFGSGKSAHATCKNVLIDMKAEDFAHIELGFNNGVYSTITLDYFSVPKRNFLEIQCEKGVMRWDVVQNTVVWTNQKGKSRIKKYYTGMSAEEARNDMFIREVKYFMMDVLNKKKSLVSPIAHAEEVTRLLLVLRQSDRTRKVLKISRSN